METLTLFIQFLSSALLAMVFFSVRNASAKVTEIDTRLRGVEEQVAVLYNGRKRKR